MCQEFELTHRDEPDVITQRQLRRIVLGKNMKRAVFRQMKIGIPTLLGRQICIFDKLARVSSPGSFELVTVKIGKIAILPARRLPNATMAHLPGLSGSGAT